MAVALVLSGVGWGGGGALKSSRLIFNCLLITPGTSGLWKASLQFLGPSGVRAHIDVIFGGRLSRISPALSPQFSWIRNEPGMMDGHQPPWKYNYYSKLEHV